MTNYLVVGVSFYDFKDEKTGKQIKGATIHFLDKAEETNFMGYRPGKFKAPIEIIKNFTNVPGYYDLDIKIKAMNDGKPTLTLTGARYITSVNLGPATTAARPAAATQ